MVRGPHLALGYLGADSGRFTDDPAAGHRCFDTGDLGRRGPDGAVTIVARADSQAKVHGVRVELAEVDRWLRTLSGVRDAATAVRRGPDGTNELMAALVTVHGQYPPDLPAVRGRLRVQLPEPMLPRNVVVLSALPLTPNGKVDRSAIARIAPTRPVPHGRTPGSSTGTEAAVSDTWQRLLELDEVDPTANFFDLGGSSILVPRMQAALADRLGRTVPVAALFEHPTVRDLARYLSGDALAGSAGAMRPGAPEGRARLRSKRLAARDPG
jgi:acyl carrier protein